MKLLESIDHVNTKTNNSTLNHSLSYILAYFEMRNVKSHIWQKIPMNTSPTHLKGSTSFTINVSQRCFVDEYISLDFSKKVVKSYFGGGGTDFAISPQVCIYGITAFNTLKLIQNGRHFPDDIFKCIFLKENERISNNMPLNFVP